MLHDLSQVRSSETHHCWSSRREILALSGFCGQSLCSHLSVCGVCVHLCVCAGVYSACVTSSCVPRQTLPCNSVICSFCLQASLAVQSRCVREGISAMEKAGESWFSRSNSDGSPSLSCGGLKIIPLLPECGVAGRWCCHEAQWLCAASEGKGRPSLALLNVGCVVLVWPLYI